MTLFFKLFKYYLYIDFITVLPHYHLSLYIPTSFIRLIVYFIFILSWLWIYLMVLDSQWCLFAYKKKFHSRSSSNYDAFAPLSFVLNCIYVTISFSRTSQNVTNFRTLSNLYPCLLQNLYYLYDEYLSRWCLYCNCLYEPLLY